MEMDYQNYADMDEQEIRQEEEMQIKEIQELLVNELDGIELDDSSSSDDCNDSNSIDYDNVTSSPPSNANNAAVDYCPLYVSHWPFANGFQQQHYNMQYNNNNNNDNIGIVDSSINWEISLYDEMGVSRPTHDDHGLFPPDKGVYVMPSNDISKAISHPNSSHSGLKVITRDVAIECIPASQRELDNLELLYSSRGKKIEQLQQELDLEREKRIKETRICNHKVILLESELKNQSNDLKRSNEELEEQRQMVTDNKQVISEQKEKIAHLDSNIEELKEKVYSSNIVIESLNEQIAELTSTSVITRSNQKQSDLLDCINRQFDTDSQRLREEVHRLSLRLDQKINEIKKLETLLDEKTENYRKEKQEWRGERDRIIEELECEKKYCKELETSQNQAKIEQLNNQIGDLNLKKSLSEDVISYLEDQVQNLSHQLLVYEKSMNLLDSANNGFSVDQSYCELKDQPKYQSSCPSLSTVGLAESDDRERKTSADHCNMLELRKQVSMLTKRSHSLTNRLLDVRKINLDSKSSVKKYQKLSEDYRQSKENLEDKILQMEKRLKEIQSEEDTTVEKHLKISIESLKTINGSLEQECKNLQNQLRKATCSKMEMDKNYKHLEEEFEAFKQFAQEDKETSIEHIKQVCNNHYDNLREQLESSWMSERDILLEEANGQRDKILQELSDAINEVDRVKNLYIQLSQQKSNEESERTNWNEWLEKKLQDQKRSLNQQFKTDQDLIMRDLQLQHRQEMENLKFSMDQRITEPPTSLSYLDKAVETDLPEQLSFSFETQEISVQVDSLMDMTDLVNELQCNNQTFETAIRNLEEENANIRKQCEEINCQKLAVENENLLLASKFARVQSSLTGSENLNGTATNQEKLVIPNQIPSIIRSTTPQLILESKRNNNSSLNTRISTTKIHQQFKLLKEDLIKQLSKIPCSMPLVDYSTDDIPNINGSHSILSNDSFSEREMNGVKQKLYNVVLEIQARAASTLQLELQKAQIFIRKSLLEKIRNVIPILLSVDGQLIDIPASKIKILSDRIILTLNHLQTDDDNMLFTSNSVNSSPFSLTSTPRNQKSAFNFHPDISIIKFDDVANNVSCDDSINPNKLHENLLQEKYIKLKDEISQLSEALNKSHSQIISSSSQTQCPFQNVDKSLLADMRYSQ